MRGTTIRLQFSYTPSDLIHARRFYNSKRIRNKVDKLWAVFVFGVGCFTLWLNYVPSYPNQIVVVSFSDLLLPTFFFLASIIIWFDLATTIRIWMHFRKNEEMPAKPYSFVFDSEGAEFRVDVTTEQTQVKLSWSEFKNLHENNRAFLLLLKDGEYWTLPKIHFESPDQIAAFRNLVSNKLTV